MAENSIDKYGAVGDGRCVCTAAIAAAIEACASAGGGRVVVPPGDWLTGPIALRSGVELHLHAGATVRFTARCEDYPLVLTDYEGQEAVRCMSPLHGQDLANVAITGQGVLDGQGEFWRPVKKFKRTEQEWAELVASGGVVDEQRGMWWPSRSAMAGASEVRRLRDSARPLRIEDYEPYRHYLRPNMVKLAGCRNVRLEGVTLRNSPAWTAHLLLCRGVTVHDVSIHNPWYAANADGLDLDSCEDVTVRDCRIDTGDDGICIKSGKDEAGRRRGRPSQNIDIANCTVLRAHGGVTIGSEMSGGVRNVRVRNCIFRGTDIGLRFKSTRGRGGVVENIDIANVAMHDIRHEAISLNLYYMVRQPRPEPVGERTPTFRAIHMRNVTCDGAERAMEIRGLPEMPIEAVTMEDIRIRARRGASLSDAQHLTLRNVRLDVETPPALRCHNVSGLRMENVSASGPAETPGEVVGDL